MPRIPLFRSTILSLAILAAHASAQGSDDCATATVISGGGNFPVSTVGATDSPEQTGVCPSAHRDVWFKWTAPATQTTEVSLCGTTITDTVLAVYPGPACPTALASQIACNDDACLSQQSSLFFNAVAGNTYLIQMGAWSTLPTWTSTFSLQAGSTPCAAANGPDVLIGEITDIMNVVAAGGLDAFTVGTTACNVGNTVVQWWGNTNEHPVISETFYKHSIVNGAGRFEQVGMSWLKHGFAADTGSLCCPCQNPGNSQLLGVGCSDPYLASQAGAQSGLAPRWQINAHTGVFPFPTANPSWSGTTARRCEVLLSDLEPSSASVRYWVEATYTTADDAQAGNNNNNASYEEITVTGGPTNYTFATTGPVQPGEPAIRAWPLVEPGVLLADVQVPNDGLFVVGSHATPLGGGQYHYEFAVHNMNSARDAGSFSVPIPAGAIVTNVGFHDITYRNGDGIGNVSQTSTDWPGVVAGGLVTWSTQTPAQNLNANAIRWATTYNFRFDANVPPTTGAVSVGLWDAGAPSSFAAAAQIPAGEPSITSSCPGDGSGSSCPCANSGATGHGCENSAGTGGSLLTATGTPSLAADDVQFTASGELPTALSIVLQGNVAIAPVNYGDGLRCTGGALKRLYNKAAVGGVVTAPQVGDPSVSARSAALGATLPLGATRLYQVYYRDTNPGFCPTPPGNNFNVSNALTVIWGL